MFIVKQRRLIPDRVGQTFIIHARLNGRQVQRTPRWLVDDATTLLAAARLHGSPLSRAILYDPGKLTDRMLEGQDLIIIRIFGGWGAVSVDSSRLSRKGIPGNSVGTCGREVPLHGISPTHWILPYRGLNNRAIVYLNAPHGGGYSSIVAR